MVLKKQLLKYFALCITMMLFSAIANAQQCEWIDLFGGSGSNYNLTHTVDDSNNVVAVGRYTSTITRGSTSFYLSLGLNIALVKYKPDGTTIWMTRMKGLDTTQFSSVNINTIVSYNNEYYVVGSTSGNIDFGNGINIPSSSTSYIFLLKYNTNGVAQWVKPFHSTATSYTYWGGLDTDNDGNLVLTFGSGGRWYFSSTDTVSTGSPSQIDIFVVKFNGNGSFIWGKHFGSSSLTKHDASRSISIDGNNNIYIGGVVDSVVQFGTQTFYDKGHVILKLDSAGNPVKGINLPYAYSSYGVNAGISAFPDGKVAFTGYLKDSMDLGNSIKLYSTGTSTTNVVFALFDKNLDCEWAKQCNPSAGALIIFAGVKISNSNIYSGGTIYGQVVLGSTAVGSIGTSSFCVIKMDTLGNYLWAFSGTTNGGVYTIGPDNEGNAYVGGGVNDSIELFGVKKYCTGQSSGIFLAKLKDYEITRGNVSPGPYCAGDSIVVPYSIEGRFIAGNEFIAELSDSAGNFDFGGRELGRVTDTLGGTIKGVLPLFNVATNNRYRIRIISTKPFVQSYYRVDTLRLLIYSKDTANAGPDLYVCKGQPIRLGTTGGSRWQWSPSTFMPYLQDTVNRQPLIKPDSATEYRIIISDSSGCGEIDTDYVKVFIRPPLTKQIIGPSASCRGQKVLLTAAMTGGDSTGYWYNWSVSGDPTTISTTDTVRVSPYKTTTYRIIMGDSCHPKPDTLFYTLQIDTVLKVLTNRDTTICRGSTAYLQAWGNGCDPSQYEFNWTVFGNSTVIATGPRFAASPTATTLYRVTLRDKATTYSASRNVRVTVDNVFFATLTADTTICAGQSLQVRAGAASCDTSQLHYEWDNGLDTLQGHTVSPNVTTTYTVIVSSKTNGLKDTAQITVTVRPSLTLTLPKDTTVCVGTSLPLTANATGGAGNHKLLWTVNTSLWTDTSFTINVTPSLSSTYRAVLSDNCSTNDTAFVKVTLRDSLKVSLPYTDTAICYGEQLMVNPAGKGGIAANYSYSWRFPDGTVVNGKQPAINPTSSGTYKVFLTDNCSKPSDSATMFVHVRPALKTKVIGPTKACEGDTLLLTVAVTGGDSSNYSYTWVLPNGSIVQSKTITVTPTGTATYKVIAVDGCSNPAADSSLHTITLPPPISLTPSADITVCQGSNVPLSATIVGGTPANYQILWQEIGGSFSASSKFINVQPSVSTQYSISVKDGCASPVADTVTVSVLPTPAADFAVTPTKGCAPFTPLLTDLSQNNDTSLNIWRVASTEKQGASPAFTITKNGNYTIELVASNNLGCKDSVKKYSVIEVFALPKANFMYHPEHETEIGKPVTFYNYSTGAQRYNWFWSSTDSMFVQTPNDIKRVFADTGKQLIKLVAINSNNCTDTFYKEIYVHDQFSVVIPNSFTPNGDGLNDVFSIVNTGTLKYSISIFNRWGECLYTCSFEEGQSLPCSWDGTYNDVPVTTGSYLYQIGFESELHLKRNVWGTLNLIR